MLANAILIPLIASFPIAGAVRRLPMYETFIDGAKEGFTVAVGIVWFTCVVGLGLIERFSPS